MEPINETVVRQLLALYLEGETTLAQEQQLAAYFGQSDHEGENLPDDLQPYRALFQFFKVEAAVLPTPQKAIRSPRNLIRLFVPLAAVAACVLLFFALFSFEDDDFIYYKDGQRIRDKAEALHLAQQQLDIISIHAQKAGELIGKLEQIPLYTEIISKYISK